MRKLILVALLLGCAPASAQTAAPLKFALAPKPLHAPFAAPNRPHWKLTALLKAHAKDKSWSQTLVRDPDGLTGKYIQMAPGEKSKTVLYSDSLTFFIVQAGQMRVSIDGEDPFVASKGFVVQVPSLRPFSVETVGAAPSLRFEVTHTQALPVYPVDETPSPIKGEAYRKVAYFSAAGSYGGKKPYLDYWKDIVEKGGSAAGFVRDDFTAANISRGPAVPRPPTADKGHFHIGTSEFWFVMEGRVDYQIEDVPFFTAAQGDIVYAPAGRWHRATFGGTGMASRVSIHPVGNAMNALEPDAP